jgi:hypothetical protein
VKELQQAKRKEEQEVERAKVRQMTMALKESFVILNPIDSKGQNDVSFDKL